MSQPEERQEETRIHCRRLDAQLTVGEHGQCSYCHGRRADIGSGEHKHFCDYDPDKDPINFGSPPNDERIQRG